MAGNIQALMNYSYYGRFFLNWYSKVLIDHGSRVLSLANQVFEGFPIAAKVRKQCFRPCFTGICDFNVLSTVEGWNVLSLMKSKTFVGAQLSGIHYWWYKTASHAAELTARFYIFNNWFGYAPIAVMLKQHEAALNFTCVELRTMDQHESYLEALTDPEALAWQVCS
uniref:Beta-amylase n=1 Tax=Chenopodium quinoa TaxID=63459 RepID=A0A803KZ92_CHEQI